MDIFSFSTAYLSITLAQAKRRFLAIEKGGIRSMPNSWLPPTVNKTPGLVLLGDALNMRHPLTGGGMTVALTDVVLLSSLLEKIPTLSDSSEVPFFLKTVFNYNLVSLCRWGEVDG